MESTVMNHELSREINEAIRAGENAINSLHQAKRYLNGAKNWGLIDVFGGDWLTGLIKHSKLNDARKCMDRARYDLVRFRDELDDVDEYLPDIEINTFLTFADFFFDGFIADVFVQSKIGKARRDVDEAIYQVESIVNRLRMERL